MSSKGPSPLHLDQQLCFALHAASRAMTRAYAPLLEPLGVTYPQYLVLVVLWEKEGLSVKQLGERLFLDSATLTPLLKRLEQEGLVTRTRAPEDERIVRIELTDAGRALEQKAQGIPIGIACRVGCDPSQPAELAKIGALRDQLQALRAQLEAFSGSGD
jgi:DNA-binding MarR family transcriptional regulator